MKINISECVSSSLNTKLTMVMDLQREVITNRRNVVWAGENRANLGKTFNGKTLSYVGRVGREAAFETLLGVAKDAENDLRKNQMFSSYIVRVSPKGSNPWRCDCVEIFKKSRDSFYIKFTVNCSGLLVIDFHD